MTETPLESRAILWTTQDIVGLYCIRFSSVRTLKGRVSGPPLLLLLLLLPMLAWLWLSPTLNPSHRYPTKMARSDKAQRSNSKLSEFSRPPTSSLSEMSGSKLDTRNYPIRQTLCVSVSAVICHYCEYHYNDSFGTSIHDVTGLSLLHFSRSQRRAIWLKNWHCLPTFIQLTVHIKNESGKCSLTRGTVLLFQFCTENVTSHGL